METKYDKWVKLLTIFCERHSYAFEIQQHAPVGYGGQFISFRIHIPNDVKDFVIIQSGQKANDVIGLNHLYTTVEEYTGKSLKLSIREYEFLDRLFYRKRILTGNELFDSKFFVNSSDINLALQIFTDTVIQNFFIRNRFVVSNIHSTGPRNTITMKDMRNIIFSSEELSQFISVFSLILKHVHAIIEQPNSKKIESS